MAIEIHNNNNDMYCDVAADALAVLTMGGGGVIKKKHDNNITINICFRVKIHATLG